jgi:hypothetical protein
MALLFRTENIDGIWFWEIGVVILGFFLTIYFLFMELGPKNQNLIIHRQIRPYSKVLTLYIALKVFFSDRNNMVFTALLSKFEE